MSLSVSLKALKMLSMLTITDVRRATVIMEEILFPTHTIIIGARAVFGIELSITRYGSKTSFKNEFHHKITAIAVPINVERRKPAVVSVLVTAVWYKREDFFIMSAAQSIIAFGELKIKGSIMPKSEQACQRMKNTAAIIILA